MLSTDLLQREHPKIFAGIWMGWRKKKLLAYKSSNISETWQDRTKITIEVQQEVTYVLSTGAKVNDLRRPQSNIQGH